MNVLILGNSYTSANGLPQTIAMLVGANVVAHTRGGGRLAEHLNPKTCLGKMTQEVLRDGSWDFVIMQEMSNGPIRFREKFVQSVSSLSDQIREAGAEPILFETWAYQRGSTMLEKSGLTREQMSTMPHDAYAEAARVSHARVAWAGDAFEAKTLAGRNLYPPERGRKPACGAQDLRALAIAAGYPPSRPSPPTPNTVGT